MSVFSRISRLQCGHLAGCLEHVIRHARIGAGDAIENVVERNFRVGVTLLARFNQVLCFAQCVQVHKDVDLFFRSGSKKSRFINGGLEAYPETWKPSRKAKPTRITPSYLLALAALRADIDADGCRNSCEAEPGRKNCFRIFK